MHLQTLEGYFTTWQQMKLLNALEVSTFNRVSGLAAKKAKPYSTLQQELAIMREQGASANLGAFCACEPKAPTYCAVHRLFWALFSAIRVGR